MAEERYRGIVASGGLASGPAVVLHSPQVSYRSSGGPAQEAERLREAIAHAAAAIDEAMAVANTAEQGILEFHRVLVEDENLWRPAFQAIAAGTEALFACLDTLNAEAAEFSNHSSPDFRARADDILDIRDRVSGALAGAGQQIVPPGSILLAEELGVSTFLMMDWSKGGAIVLRGGSPRSHLALLARARGIPMLVQTGRDLTSIGGHVLVDAEGGELVADPSEATQARFHARLQSETASEASASSSGQPAETIDGQVITVSFNIAREDEVESLPEGCAGIGLVRTEFLFSGRSPPDEERQFQAYKRLVDNAAGKPIVVRLFDFGGDKPLPETTRLEQHALPPTMRGIRLLCQMPGLLQQQVRALVRASAFGDLRILVPMVSKPEEISLVRRLVADETIRLRSEGLESGTPQVGMMVEVPVAAMAIESFDADFYSLGTNDLVQFLTASDRSDARSDPYADLCHPAILRLVKAVIHHALLHRKEITCCGDAAADPDLLPALLSAGLRSISVSPAIFQETRRLVAGIDLSRRQSVIPLTGRRSP